MATEIQNNWINKLSANLKATIASSTDSEQDRKLSQIEAALRKEMSDEIRENRFSGTRGAIYALMKVV
ncbi:MAG: hypothetical protein ACXAE3_09405 [Candidatus Kariarchaeaceae archaeon]|jgi:hypothetical protein